MHADALHTHNPLFAPFTIDNGDATEGYLVIAEEIASVGFAITCKSELSDTVRAYVEAGVPSRLVLELTGASSGDMRLSDHAARSMI